MKAFEYIKKTLILVGIVAGLLLLYQRHSHAQGGMGPGPGTVHSTGGGGGAPTVVHATPCNGTGVTITTICTIPSTGSGNVLLLTGYYFATGFPTVAVVNSAANTVTDGGRGDQYDGNSVISFSKAFLAASSGVTTITITLSAAAGGDYVIYEVSGLASKVFDAVPISNINSTTVNLTTTPTGTLTASSEFAAAVFTNYGTTMTGAGGGFTTDSSGNNGGTGISFNIMSQAVSSNASLTASTTAAGVVLGMGIIATLK